MTIFNDSPYFYFI